MPVIYGGNASKFGIDLSTEFRSLISRPILRGPAEIKKFEKLIQSFKSLRPCFTVEQYHGYGVSGVSFDSNPPFTSWVRPNPRCELADVMFLVFNKKEMRVSFLQAKAKNNRTPLPVYFPNTEQVALLKYRPEITNWHSKVPPPWSKRILSSAVLPSVGSFGIFYDKFGYNTDVEFAYYSGHIFEPTIGPSPGKTYIHGWFDINQPLGPSINVTHGYEELTYCDDLKTFGAALYSFHIGTPINMSPHGTKDMYSMSILRSLSQWVGYYSDEETEVLSELKNVLRKAEIPVEPRGPVNFGVRDIVVIYSPEEGRRRISMTIG